MLNVALDHLPAEAELVAWIDCDVVFKDEIWPRMAGKVLENVPITQLYRDFYDLPVDVDPASFIPPDGRSRNRSLASVLFDGLHIDDKNLTRPARGKSGALHGLAWAARTEEIKACRFYDYCPIGSGDWAMTHAILGRPDMVEEFMFMNAMERPHYRRWAGSVREVMGSEIGFIDTTIFHLWHGDVANRRYRIRHEEFSQFNFDPEVDIALVDIGNSSASAWRWNSDKPEMHDYLREYFASRKEDGA